MLRLKKILVGLLVVAGPVALFPPPAHALLIDTAIVGVVDGSVAIDAASGTPPAGCPTTTAGIPAATAPRAATNYRFCNVAITGTFKIGNNIGIGLFNVTGVTGASAAENAISATGTVASAATPAAISCTNVLPSGSIDGSFSGTFNRTGPVVEVTLNVTGNFYPLANCAGAKTTGNGVVKVAAAFVPTGVDAANNVNNANFAGLFVETV